MTTEMPNESLPFYEYPEENYFIYVLGENEEIIAGHLAKMMIGIIPINKKDLAADQVYVCESTNSLFGASSTAILSPFDFAVELLDTYCPKDADNEKDVNSKPAIVEDPEIDKDLESEPDERSSEIIEDIADNQNEPETLPALDDEAVGLSTKELFITESESSEPNPKDKIKSQRAVFDRILDDKVVDQIVIDKRTKTRTRSQIEPPQTANFPELAGQESDLLDWNDSIEFFPSTSATSHSAEDSTTALEVEDSDFFPSDNEDDVEQFNDVLQASSSADSPQGMWRLPTRRPNGNVVRTDTTNTIFGLTEKSDKWDREFAPFPPEFRKHVYEEHRYLYDYDGPLVLLTVSVCEYAGEKDPSAVCLFCNGLYKRLSIHLKVSHKNEPRVKDILKLATQKERDVGFYNLLKEGNFNFNLMCISNDRGYLISTRKATSFLDLRTMIHCIRCYSLLQRKNFTSHMKNSCPNRDKEGPFCTIQEANLSQQKIVPPSLRETQDHFLVQTLKSLRDPARQKLCIEDNNIRNYLVYAAFKKLHGASTQKNLRSTANCIARFFEPLWEQLNAKTTSDILIMKNAPHIMSRLIEFGDFSDINQQKRFGQNARVMIPILKNLAGYAEMEATALYGKLSPNTQAHTLLLNEMECNFKWFHKIFPKIQPKLRQLHSKLEEELLNPEVRDKFIRSVRKHVLEQGVISKGLDKLRYGDKVTLYENIVDGAAALLLTTGSECCLNKVENLKLECWEKGIKNHPLKESMAIRIGAFGQNTLNIPPTLIKVVGAIIKLRPLVGVHAKNPFLFAKVGSKYAHRNTYPFISKKANICGASNAQSGNEHGSDHSGQEAAIGGEPDTSIGSLGHGQGGHSSQKRQADASSSMDLEVPYSACSQRKRTRREKRW